MVFKKRQSKCMNLNQYCMKFSNSPYISKTATVLPKAYVRLQTRDASASAAPSGVLLITSLAFITSQNRTIWKFLDDRVKAKFRSLEKVEKKIIETRLHLEFNQICLNENLLPVYTCINICMYVYIYMHMEINF